MEEINVRVGLLPADYAWLVMITGAVVFEFASQDLLSQSAERMVKRHPVLTRVGILALAGHLAVVLPYHIDLFNAKNLFHRGVVTGYRSYRRATCR